MAVTPTYAAAGVNLRVLLVGADEALLAECRSALASLPDRRAVLYFTASTREAVDIARDRQPHFVIVEIGDRPDAIAALSRDLHAVVPEVLVAAAYLPNQSGDGGSDTAAIIELLRAEVRDFLRRPLSPIELSGVLDRLLSNRPQAAAKSGRVVSFVSNKGGVGKSTMSVNVACALARRHPDQVLLIDASLQLGVCGFMLGLSPAATILDVARERDRLDDVLLRGLTTAHPSGLRLLAAPIDAIEAADISDEAVARLLNLARRTFAFVIVDTFPLLDSVVMAVLDASDLIFVVSQATAPSVAGTARLVPLLDGLGFPVSRQRIVLNRNHRRFLGDLTTADIEARLNRRVDHAVPYDRGVLVSMNTGEPHVLRANRWSAFGRAVIRIVDAVDQLESGSGGALLDVDTADRRSRFDADQRSGRDRRIKDVGYIGGERRSRTDRRRQPGVSPVDRIHTEVVR